MTWLLATPALSHAHANLISPPPRDGSDGYKDPQGPCGPPPHTSPTMYQPGQKITVTWIETVYHPGCFLIDFSSAGDQNWQALATIPHDPKTATPINYSTQVTLPQGNCPSCTLRVRQIMLGSQTDTCPPTNILSGQTYYSCADIALGSTQATADLGQTAPPPADLGMADAASPMAMASGCHAAPVGVATGSLAGIGILGLAALGLVRRRRA